VTITAAPAFSAISMAGTRSAHTRVVFGDVAGVVQRHVQVSTDENALALGFALGAQVGRKSE
jgi:hypothetical protein